MSKALKTKGANTLVWILMALLIFGLGGFGITNFGGGVTSIGTVGDREIDVNDYARALQQELAAFGAQIGQEIPLSQAQTLGLDRSVRQQLVTTAALDNETARIGISVGDERVLKEILAISSFQGIDGNFDRDAYKFSLQNNNMTEAEFETGVREDVARTLLQGAAVAAVTAPAAYVDRFFAYVGEKRDFTLLRLEEFDLTTPIGEGTPEELDAYYKANAEAFTRPEAKAITYAALLPEMLADKVEIDETALREQYDLRIDEFVQPERRLVERLVFGTEEEASAARAAIDAGTIDFETLVRDRGLELRDIDLGDVAADDLGAAGEAVFALDEPGVVGPLASDLGPALFRVNAILEAQETSFEDARPDLVTEFAQDAARRMISDQIENIDDLLAGGATLEELAKDTGMKLASIDYYAGVDSEIAAYEDFRAAAQALADGDFPEAISLEDGGVVAMRLDEVKAPALRPFDEVAEAVAEGWHNDELVKRLTGMAEAAKDGVEAGQDMLDFGIVQHIPNLTRNGFVEDVPPTLIATGFSLALGEVAVIKGDKAAFVLRLDAVHTAEAEGEDAVALRSGIEAQLTQAMAQDAFALFSGALQAEAGISLNQAAINAVHAQFR